MSERFKEFHQTREVSLKDIEDLRRTKKVNSLHKWFNEIKRQALKLGDFEAKKG